MMDQLCLDMAAKGMVTDCVSLYIVYSGHQGIPGTGDSAKFTRMTNLSTDIVPAIDTLYRLIVDPKLPIRRVNISCGVSPERTTFMKIVPFPPRPNPRVPRAAISRKTDVASVNSSKIPHPSPVVKKEQTKTRLGSYRSARGPSSTAPKDIPTYITEMA